MPIIVGFVPTDEGRAALTAAIGEARSRDSRLVVVNTSTGASLVDARYASEGQLGEARRELEESGVDYELSQSVDSKDAADVIVATARRTNAELIVIGLRRRTPVGKLIMGSQAQTVLLDADCPVLAVKAQRD